MSTELQRDTLFFNILYVEEKGSHLDLTFMRKQKSQIYLNL